MNQNGPRAKTTITSFRILEAVRHNRGAGVSELARTVDLTKSAVYKHVQTLTDLGYLVLEDDGYYLSIRFLSLGLRARDRLPLGAASNVIEDLAETTGHVGNLIVPENYRGVYAIRAEPPEWESDNIIEGDVAPLHTTAGGKAILAFYDSDRRQVVLDHVELKGYTKRTITDRRELERELRSVRDQGVAFDREEFKEGIQCVASPVSDDTGSPVAAVSVTGDVHHMSGKRLEEDVTGLVTSAARSIENDLISS